MLDIMRVCKAQTMRNIDRYCMESLGIKGIILMENAAKAIYEEVEIKLKDVNGKCVTIVSGVGNNGGDGVVLARYLYLNGYKVNLFIVGSLFSGSNDFKENLTILNNINLMENSAIYINYIEETNLSDLERALSDSSLIVDGIFGTGLKREVEGIHATVISMINKSKKYIISIDVPSGMDSDSGRVLGTAVKANRTVTLQLYKTGFLNYEAFSYCGDIVVKDIGIPKRVTAAFGENIFLTNENFIKKAMPLRQKFCHKGDLGKILIIAGSKTYTGAAYLATQGAVNCGGGLVTVATSKDIKEILQVKLAEAMVTEYDKEEQLTTLMERSDVIAIGPGMGCNEDSLRLVKKVLDESKKPIVIDADGINLIKEHLPFIRNRAGQIILTPHLGEFSRLTGLSIDEIEENRLEIAEEFAREYNLILVLKGYNTIITDGNKTMVNTTGNSAMASGGMGDVLTGMIASFIGQGIPTFEAVTCAVYIHGACGDRLEKDKYFVKATDILDMIAFVIKEVHR